MEKNYDDPRQALRQIETILLKRDIGYRREPLPEQWTMSYDDLFSHFYELREASDYWVGPRAGVCVNSEEHINPWPLLMGNSWPYLLIVHDPAEEYHLPRTEDVEPWDRAAIAYLRSTPYDFSPSRNWGLWFGLLAPDSINGTGRADGMWCDDDYGEARSAWISGRLVSFLVMNDDLTQNVWTAHGERKKGYATSLLRAAEEWVGKELPVSGMLTDLAVEWMQRLEQRKGFDVLRLDQPDYFLKSDVLAPLDGEGQ